MHDAALQRLSADMGVRWQCYLPLCSLGGSQSRNDGRRGCQSARDQVRRDEPEAFGEIILASPSRPSLISQAATQPITTTRPWSLRQTLGFAPSCYCRTTSLRATPPRSPGLDASCSSHTHPKPVVAASHPVHSLSSCDRAWRLPSPRRHPSLIHTPPRYPIHQAVPIDPGWNCEPTRARVARHHHAPMPIQRPSSRQPTMRQHLHSGSRPSSPKENPRQDEDGCPRLHPGRFYPSINGSAELRLPTRLIHMSSI
jgi:hypothetical protein